MFEVFAISIVIIGVVCMILVFSMLLYYYNSREINNSRIDEQNDTEIV